MPRRPARTRRSQFPTVGTIQHGFEVNGRHIRNQPVPDHATSRWLSVTLENSSYPMPDRSEMAIDMGVGELIHATQVDFTERDEEHYIHFDLPTESIGRRLEILWRDLPLAEYTVPKFSQEAFVDSLQVCSPTVFAQMGEQMMPCRVAVAKQTRGLIACARVQCSMGLSPISNSEIRVEWQETDGRTISSSPARLLNSQLGATEALICTALTGKPPAEGTTSIQWKSGRKILARAELELVKATKISSWLEIKESGFISVDQAGQVSTTAYFPGFDGFSRIGPWFIVASKEPGAVAQLKVKVLVSRGSGNNKTTLAEEPLMITDNAAFMLPGTLSVDEVEGALGFEVYQGRRRLCTLPFKKLPRAKFDSEGAFSASQDYTWGSAQDSELTERMSKLIPDSISASLGKL